MLMLFPELLNYSFFAPTLLRVAAGIVLIYMMSRMWATKQSIANVCMPIIGFPSMWMVGLSALITGGIGLALVVGAWTQIAAALGAIVGLKHAFGSRGYASIVPLSLATNLLLAVICLSIMLTGAGAIAFDLPL